MLGPQPDLRHQANLVFRGLSKAIAAAAKYFGSWWGSNTECVCAQQHKRGNNYESSQRLEP
jgi:hypothetical protein